ncbi:hypothetical protein [Aliivibrio fischeri]|uniref:hypothetical protein n=1 Tax=Aliivibrio fischeri TaxID=668 RepID=UPI0007C48462|nr:hypothetical protein [Aliivibrio fischeri]
MHIYIFGNLNSGKTMLSQQICKRLPSYSYLSLDEYRVKYSDGSLLGEQQACDYFVSAVNQVTDAIIEFSGYGPVAEKLQLQFKKKQGVLIYCSRDIEESISTIDDQKYKKIPYPESYKQVQTLEETIRFLSDKITLNILESDWQEHIWQSYTFEFGQDFTQFWKLFPFRAHQWADKLRHILCDDSNVSTALFFGSLGANQLTFLSDIDLFIQSECSVENWYSKLLSQLAPELVHTDVLGSKITLRTIDGQLIEVVIGKSLSDISLYYRESQIYNVNFTILKAKDKQRQELAAITQEKSDNEEKVIELASQVYFLFCSLPNLITKNDSYKYSFHCSIMLHYCVQLEHIIMGKKQHNYLPKYAATTLDNFPWQAFSTSPIDIQSSQYKALYQYLTVLFTQLKQHKLIDNKNYFSKENLFLHQIKIES